MKGEVTFIMREIKSYGGIKALLEKKITNKEAAHTLNLSSRQINRIKKKVKEFGPLGVLHGNKGRRPPHAFSEEKRFEIIKLVKNRYFDFNFSHLSEILQEQEGIIINRETLRKWLRPLGFGKKRKLPCHRKKRNRSLKEGQMLFLDGSPHRWFGNKPSTLILCSDDATGKPLYGIFQKQEDLDGCFRVCLEVFKRNGLPLSFYLDRASQFTTTRHKGVHLQQSDHKPTQFERAIEEIGVHLIFANSPQARERAERINGTFQDRLVSELRLKGIDTEEEATRYLNQKFIPSYCSRFAVEPEDKVSAWRALPGEVDLRNILCKRFQRAVKNDNTILVNGTQLQLLPTRSWLHFAKAKVHINLWVDGSFHVFHPKEGEIPCEVISWEKSSNQCKESSKIWLPQNPETQQGVTFSHCKKGDIFKLQ